MRSEHADLDFGDIAVLKLKLEGKTPRFLILKDRNQSKLKLQAFGSATDAEQIKHLLRDDSTIEFLFHVAA